MDFKGGLTVRYVGIDLPRRRLHSARRPTARTSGEHRRRPGHRRRRGRQGIRSRSRRRADRSGRPHVETLCDRERSSTGTRATCPALLAGHLRRVVCDSSGVVIDLGRRQRFFTGAARLAATLLHTRCVYTGCRVPVAKCQADHMQEWQHGGPTDQANAAPPVRLAQPVHDQPPISDPTRPSRPLPRLPTRRNRSHVTQPEGAVHLPTRWCGALCSRF